VDPIPFQRPAWWKQFPLTVLIAGINIAVFVMAEKAGSTLKTETLLQFGASERSLVWAGEYWRFFTPMFLHIGVIHLIWNLYGMFSLCILVERLFGSGRFGLAYLLTGSGATAVSLLSHDAVSAGASGAAFGLVGIAFVLMYRRAGSFRAFMDDPTVRANLVSVGIWIALGFTLIRGVDNWAHLGGLFFGVLIGLVYTVRPARRRWAWAGVALLWVGTVAAASVRMPWQEESRMGLQTYLEGERAQAKGDAALARERYDRAEALGHRSRELFFNRGLLKQAEGDFVGAREDFTRALELDPNFAKAYRSRAQVRAKLGDELGAAEDRRKANEIPP
jgi:rhomboid protease GluP